MKRTVTLVLAGLLASLIGCSSYLPVSSMRGADVAAADKAPDQKRYTERLPDADAKALIPRTFTGQPPLVPHTVAKYEPITVEENACLDCHITDEFKGRKMPRVGDSHFSKTRKESDGTPAVSMMRWQCNSCHVAQADAKPLVDNDFVGNKQ
ncbi:MAG: nitrate reductase cytochrome c-type subunit [Ignavibacteria bacterium]